MRQTLSTIALVITAVAVAVVVYVGSKSQNDGAAVEDQSRLRNVLEATEPREPVAYWIGDSYTQGVGAVEPSDPQVGFACLSVKEFDWQCKVSAQGGTGFINPGGTPGWVVVPERLEKDARARSDVVFIDAGRNDKDFDQTKLRAAVTDYFADVEAAYPDTEVVVIAPYLINVPVRIPSQEAFVAFERDLAAQHGFMFIDPITSGWINADSVKLTAEDNVHPDAAGHRFLAERLDEKLVKLGVVDRVAAKIKAEHEAEVEAQLDEMSAAAR